MQFVSHALSIRYSNGVTAYEEFFHITHHLTLVNYCRVSHITTTSCFRWLVWMEKSSSRTAHSWYRLYSWPCVCAVSRATLWPVTCCTISCVPQHSLTLQTTAVCPVASKTPCKSTCPLRYCEFVWYMWGHLTSGENRALYSIIVDPMSSHYLPSCSLNRTGVVRGTFGTWRSSGTCPAQRRRRSFSMFWTGCCSQSSSVCRNMHRESRKWAGQVSKVHSVIMVKTKKQT